MNCTSTISLIEHQGRGLVTAPGHEQCLNSIENNNKKMLLSYQDVSCTAHVTNECTCSIVVLVHYHTNLQLFLKQGT